MCVCCYLQTDFFVVSQLIGVARHGRCLKPDNIRSQSRAIPT